MKPMSGDEKDEAWKEPGECEAVHRIDEGGGCERDSHERPSKSETFFGASNSTTVTRAAVAPRAFSPFHHLAIGLVLVSRGIMHNGLQNNVTQ